jgi:hypothetical protein
MHRSTPAMTSFLGWAAGGSRGLIKGIQDQFGVQTMTGSFNFGESKETNQQGAGLEAMQNYGTTSVPMPPEMGKDGQIEKSAETIINFLGGNRSFPMAGPTEDRRHRLKNLKPGDVAMFDHLQQQFHFNGKGSFLTGVAGKVIRMALAEVKKKGGGQGGSGAQARGLKTRAVGVAVRADDPVISLFDTEGAPAAADTGTSSASTENGQEARNESESTQYTEVGPEKTEQVNKEHRITLPDKEIGVQVVDGSVYLGGLKDKHQFAKVKTVSGPAMNVYARIG